MMSRMGSSWIIWCQRNSSITVVNYEKQDSGRKKQSIDGTGAN